MKAKRTINETETYRFIWHRLDGKGMIIRSVDAKTASRACEKAIEQIRGEGTHVFYSDYQLDLELGSGDFITIV